MDLTEIVNYLLAQNISISTMESCTGGLLASLITDVQNASLILKFSAVTYCNEYKIKMGVNAETIDKYTVYSAEVAKEMAYNISKFAGSDLGVGITGRIKSASPDELSVDICIYDRRNDKYYLDYKKLEKDNRKDNKKEVIALFVDLFNSTIKSN